LAWFANLTEGSDFAADVWAVGIEIENMLC